MGLGVVLPSTRLGLVMGVAQAGAFLADPGKCCAPIPIGLGPLGGVAFPWLATGLALGLLAHHASSGHALSPETQGGRDGAEDDGQERGIRGVVHLKSAHRAARGGDHVHEGQISGKSIAP